jgi:hypothetical protein
VTVSDGVVLGMKAGSARPLTGKIKHLDFSVDD